MKTNTTQTSQANDPASQPETDGPTVADATQDPSLEVEKFRDLALRTAADLDNFRKRAAREKEEAIRFANTSLLEKLLPVVDNFELGLEAARTAADPAAIIQGMAMVQKQLQDFLRDHGVQQVPAEGSPFNPAHHEAVAQEHSNDVPDGHVVRQIRRGYTLRDRLLRASSVTVSKGPAS